MATTRRTPAKSTDPTPPAAPVPEVVLPPPTHVVEALARVQAEIGGIAKLSPEERRRRTGQQSSEDRGVTFAFRSIDQIAAAAQPLFGRYGVVIVPARIMEHEVREIIVNGKPWTDTHVKVKWLIYGPGGRDDFVEGESIGLGRDNSDKGANKATTGAYKNLVLRLLAIGDPADDPDQQSHEADARERRPPQRSGRDAENENAAQRVFERVVAAADEYGAELGRFGREHGGRRFGVDDLLDAEWRRDVEAEILRLESGGAAADALATAFDAEVVDDPQLFEGGRS